MESLVQVRGIAAPLLRINVDTDQIIPARFLVRTSDEGIGEGLFADWRNLPDGRPDPEFVLNRPPYDRAQILLADRNFGCGSSREGAPKALRARGLRAVIAPSFGGIFFNNCFRNGIVPVELPIEQIREIAAEVEQSGGGDPMIVDLQAEEVRSPRGRTFRFRTPTRLREMLLAGLDEVSHTLSQSDRIEAFRARDRARRPWAYSPGEIGS